MVLFMQDDTQRIEATVVIPPHPRPAASINQRRSQRILLAVPLLVTGVRTDGAPFSERTKTLVVSAQGGLIMLHEPVLSGQILTMTNVVTSENILCMVIDKNASATGTPELGVEFAEPCPHFWRVSFPPSVWSPRNPEAKRMAHLNSQPGSTAASTATPALRKK